MVFLVVKGESLASAGARPTRKCLETVKMPTMFLPRVRRWPMTGR